VPGWQRIVKIMHVQAVRRRIYKALLYIFGRLVQVSMMAGRLVVVVDRLGVVMIVAMIMRVAVHMIMRARMVRMRNMPVAG
jgi:hypothetical protein